MVLISLNKKEITMNNDFVVTKRKKEYIDQITQELRKKYDFAEAYLDIFVLFDLMVQEGSLIYHVLNEEEWQEYEDLEAFSQAHTQEIFFPESLMELIEDEDRTRARFTLAHELGHIILHETENQDTPFEQEEHLLVNSSEWQANYFAGVLLAPNEYVLSCKSHQELIDKCRISWQASNVRFHQLEMELYKKRGG